jgi:hypothetical protein
LIWALRCLSAAQVASSGLSAAFTAVTAVRVGYHLGRGDLAAAKGAVKLAVSASVRTRVYTGWRAGGRAGGLAGGRTGKLARRHAYASRQGRAPYGRRRLRLARGSVP